MIRLARRYMLAEDNCVTILLQTLGDTPRNILIHQQFHGVADALIASAAYSSALTICSRVK